MASVGAGANRVRKTFNTEAEASAWEQEEEARRGAVKASEVAQANTPAAAPCWTLQEAFDQTYKHIWKGTPGERKVLVNARQLLAFFGPDTPTSAITANRIVEWMEELQDEHENSGSTCNKKLSALNVILKRAHEFGGLEHLPRTKRYKESQHRIRWYSDAEETQMLKMTAHMGLHELHDFIIVGIDTGFRRTELLRLDPFRDYMKGHVMAHAGETKNGDARSVPATERVKAIFEKRRKDGSAKVFPTLTNSTLRKQWDDLRAILKKEDDPGFIVHVLRHTCATRLVAAGVPLPVVQAWMGHKVIQTTMRYAHLVPGAMRDAVKRLEARSVELEEV